MRVLVQKAVLFLPVNPGKSYPGTSGCKNEYDLFHGWIGLIRFSQRGTAAHRGSLLVCFPIGSIKKKKTKTRTWEFNWWAWQSPHQLFVSELQRAIQTKRLYKSRRFRPWHLPAEACSTGSVLCCSHVPGHQMTHCALPVSRATSDWGGSQSLHFINVYKVQHYVENKFSFFRAASCVLKST